MKFLVRVKTNKSMMNVTNHCDDENDDDDDDDIVENQIGFA
jgi:riboflavin synthase